VSIKAILRGGHIDNCVRLWTRHATPVAITHMIVGRDGKAFLNAVDPGATGLFVFHHPTLGDWSAVPAKAKREDGGVLHVYAGVTPDDGGEPLSEEEFAGLASVELYVRGHVEKFINGVARDGTRYCGLVLTDATFLDAIKPSVVEWRSDVTPWVEAPDKFKRADGSPRVDPDDVQQTAVVQWVEPVEPV
jgi:hypothetical protein